MKVLKACMLFCMSVIVCVYVYVLNFIQITILMYYMNSRTAMRDIFKLAMYLKYASLIFWSYEDISIIDNQYVILNIMTKATPVSFPWAYPRKLGGNE